MTSPVIPSGTSGPASSIIFHIDVNSAFLSWSAVKLLEEGGTQDLREIPSIVGGDQSTRHGIVVAKSIPAKKYGIKTADTVASAFARCPSLVMVPPDHHYYHEKSQQLMEHLSSICPVIEQVSVDECYMAYDPISHLYESPEAAAYCIKDSVKEKFGFTVNIGISDRKVLAKMASDFQKPDRVHTLYCREIREKMWPLPIEELFMCGKSSSKRFRQLGIRTIGDLAQTDYDYILQTFKSHGKMLWEFANGIDDSPVNPIRDKAKGIGTSTTLSKNALTRAEALPVLRRLSHRVARELQEQEFLAGTICVEIKYDSFLSVSHQGALNPETQDPEQLYKAACEHFDQLWNGEPIRLLGVRTTRLVDTDSPLQMNLFDYQEQVKQDDRHRKMEEAMKQVRDKFGSDMLRKGM